MEGAGWDERMGTGSERRVGTEVAEGAGTTLSPQAAFRSPTPVSQLQLSLQMFWVPSELGGVFRIPAELTSRPSPVPFPPSLFHL